MSLVRETSWKSGLLLLALAIVALPARSEIHHLSVEGVINPIKVRYIENGLRAANEQGAELVVISINTPGGLVESMQKIVEKIVNSPVPVVTFVEPQAAMATSAGAIIVFAGDVAAMVPGSTIGSAHPVGGQGEKIEGPMEDKVVNVLVSLAKSLSERRKRNTVFAVESIRSSMNLSAEQALETGAIDLIAKDVPDLLKALDGYVIDNDNRHDTLATGGLTVREVRLSKAEQFLDTIANPTIATIFMTLGVMGLIYEFSSPGIGLGAVVGSICLLLGLISLSALPLHTGGILLLILGIVMLLLEFKVPSSGLLTVGGITAITLGVFLFVDAGEYYGAVQRVKVSVVLPFIIASALLLAVCVGVTVKALRSPQRMGLAALVGAAGTVKSALDPLGTVFVDGALWEGESVEGKIEPGENVVVKEVVGRPRRLVVRRPGV